MIGQLNSNGLTCGTVHWVQIFQSMPKALWGIFRYVSPLAVISFIISLAASSLTQAFTILLWSELWVLILPILFLNFQTYFVFCVSLTNVKYWGRICFFGIPTLCSYVRLLTLLMVWPIYDLGHSEANIM